MKKNGTLSNILLAVDGSAYAQAATLLLDELLGASACTITIVAVLDTPHTPRRQLLQDALQDTQAILQKPGREIIFGLLRGNPAATICDYADDHSPDVIVLGAKGRRATLGILLGGVAQQVIEYAQQPVLIARPPFQSIKKILVTTDGSIFSRKALDFLGCMRFNLSTELHLAHVTHPYPPYESAMQPRTWLFGNDIFLPPTISEEETERWREISIANGNKILEEALLALQPCGIQPITSLLRGDAATEIIDYAKSKDINLIVTGSRGLSEVRGWLLGSVSRKLIHYSSCSVLVVKSLPKV